MAILGCIADDFTGASDLASFLVKGGMRTVLYNGIPDDRENRMNADAVVIALKTRTEDRKYAVEVSLKALAWLERNGCEHFYIKYCSTFDSTREGNIGPVCDAAMEYLNVKYTLLCPSLPVNGRTVRDGILYVNGVPLESSSMRNHPLTPMRESSLSRLMQPQSKYPVYVIDKKLDAWETEISSEHFYIVPDYETDDDGKRIVKNFGKLKLLTGGSGLAEELARTLMQRENEQRKYQIRNLLLAGSCSVATRLQIEHYQKGGKASIHLTPEMVFSDTWDIEKFWDNVRRHLMKGDVLIYSSDTPQRVREAQERFGKVSAQLENAMAEVAQKAVEEGVCRIIVAGGETSGAVTRKLGNSSFLIGKSVAPGVPVMIPCENRKLRLVLKSGNFGQEDFFERAIELLGEEIIC